MEEVRAVELERSVRFLAKGSPFVEGAEARVALVEDRGPAEVRGEVLEPLSEALPVAEPLSERRSKELVPRLGVEPEEFVAPDRVPRVLSLENISSKRLEELEEELDEAAP